MKQIITWIKADFGYGGQDRYSQDKDVGNKYLMAQIENSLFFGWKPEDIVVGTNFEFEHMGVKAHILPVTTLKSAFRTKLPSVNYLIDKLNLNDDLWLHDTDCWQVNDFNFPEILDIGMVRHSLPGRNKPQMGCVFVNHRGYDMLKQIALEMEATNATKEESFCPGFFARPEYVNRRTWLGYEFNLFRQSDFVRKYKLATLPIRIAHFKLEYTSTYNCFVLGKNRFNAVIVHPELKAIFDKYDFKPTIRR